MTKRAVSGVAYPGAVFWNQSSSTASLTLIGILKIFMSHSTLDLQHVKGTNLVQTRWRPTAHTARATMTADRWIFGERVISQHLRSPLSSELTLSYFYLWEKLKGMANANNPCTINDLKHNIRQIIDDVRWVEIQ